MTLYDRVSPTLKSITGNSRAFDKSLDELETEGIRQRPGRADGPLRRLSDWEE